MSNDERVMETGPKLARGYTLLTLGTCGVSIFALPFAEAAGSDVLSTTSSDAQVERFRVPGAREVINYCTSWMGAGNRELTGGVGIDQLIEVGGADKLKKSMMAVRYGGVISRLGVADRCGRSARPIAATW